MTEADKLVLEFAAGHDVFTLVEAYQHCQAFSNDEKTQIRKRVHLGWGTHEQKYRIKVFVFYLRITSMERMKNSSPHTLLADIMFTFICLGRQIFQSGNVTICFPF